MSKYDKYVIVGHRPDGTRIRKHIKADTIAEFNRKKEQAEVKPACVTFGAYAERWFNTFKSNREPRTREFYRSALDKLAVYNDVDIGEVTRTDIQDVINQNWEHPRTCEKIKGTAKQVFDAALADGLITRHPVTGINMPKYRPEEKRILTDEEIKAIKEADLPPMQRMFVDISLCLGLRPEETRALNKDSWDYENGTVTISNVVTYDVRTPVLRDTKNHKHRTIPVPDSLNASVRLYNAHREEFYMFVDNSSAFMSKDAYKWFTRNIFRAINSALGGDDDTDLLNGMTFYTFRHTRGTQLYYLTQQPDGISTKLAAWYMGHSEMVFLTTYSHIDRAKEDIDLLKKTY